MCELVVEKIPSHIQRANFFRVQAEISWRSLMHGVSNKNQSFLIYALTHVAHPIHLWDVLVSVIVGSIHVKSKQMVDEVTKSKLSLAVKVVKVHCIECTRVSMQAKANSWRTLEWLLFTCNVEISPMLVAGGWCVCLTSVLSHSITMPMDVNMCSFSSSMPSFDIYATYSSLYGINAWCTHCYTSR